MRKYITEFIGVFFLVLVVSLSSNPLARASILIALVYMGFAISGSHFNPAITIAVWLRKKIEGKDAIMYILVQLLGGFCAALVFRFMYGGIYRFVPTPDLSLNIMKPLLLEVLFTFALTMVVLNVATSKKTAGNSYYGLAIGLTIFAAASAAGDISGGVFNPAVGLGPLVVDAAFGGINMGHAWLYIVGPCTGGILGSVVYRITNPDEFQD